MRLFDVENALLSGAHVTLLVRHAERPPLEPGDTTFGATLPITERGREMAMAATAVSVADRPGQRICPRRT